MVINYFFFIITQNSEFIGISFKKCGSTIESEKSTRYFLFFKFICVSLHSSNQRPCASLWADTHVGFRARKSDVDNIGGCVYRTLHRRIVHNSWCIVHS